jgi:hypothetical protein
MLSGSCRRVPVALILGLGAALAMARAETKSTTEGTPDDQTAVRSPAPERDTASAEFLNWWFRDSPVPIPLVTSGPSTGAQPNIGVVGDPTTTVLIGGRDYDTEGHPGGRVSALHWLDDDHRWGLETNLLILSNQTTSRSASSDGSASAPYLTIPFLNVQPPAPFVESGNTIGGPSLKGDANFKLSNQLWGLELNGVWARSRSDDWNCDLLAGLRFVSIGEALLLRSRAEVVGTLGAVPIGAFVDSTDSFGTRNEFLGAQVGARVSRKKKRWSFSAQGKVAVGNVHQTVRINGSTTTNAGPGFLSLVPTTTIPVGVYALGTNIGEYSRSIFGVMPEVSVKVSYDLGETTQVFAGYDFLYLSNIARPGSQIDRVVNPTQNFPPFNGTGGGTHIGDVRPAFDFRDSNFWAQGITVGATVRF